MVQRCGWATTELSIAYHDVEWGVPQHDDHILFEFLILEGAQAGLSWETILKKRENYRQAFDHFDPNRIAGYGDRKIEELLANPGIIRNRSKIEGAVANAKAFLRVQREFGTFDDYVWAFLGGRPRRNHWQSIYEIPSWTVESKALSEDLKRRGFKFVGPTICYAFMQAVGMVNDHTTDCFRYDQV
jgi:DNA-3-methyladenine glycosylase I